MSKKNYRSKILLDETDFTSCSGGRQLASYTLTFVKDNLKIWLFHTKLVLFIIIITARRKSRCTVSLTVIVGPKHPTGLPKQEVRT